ncbi:GNAT family N-acetyltransferase [Syntrophomonas wolfei]|jgi:RimJ/RimL family protein N-acetyltransferase|uniref:GNAT family N-acetyltransferase n=1 Tax=Syntrophomonas wolfei TaxID=863 RepID=UPI0023EFD2EA|nr:GNAT family protein [Syntrophomonas wolfei]
MRNKDIFLKGEYVALKVLDEVDIENSNWYDWFNDEETTLFMQKHYYPNTKKQQLEFWENEIKGNENKIQLGICPAQGGGIVGCVSLNSIDYLNRKAEISTIIGEKSARNIKYYYESNKLMIIHGFYTLNLHRIYGGTIVKELADLLCRFFGFQIEGIARQDVYKNGKYHDVYRIGLLKSDFDRRLEKERTMLGDIKHD